MLLGKESASYSSSSPMLTEGSLERLTTNCGRPYGLHRGGDGEAAGGSAQMDGRSASSGERVVGSTAMEGHGRAQGTCAAAQTFTEK